MWILQARVSVCHFTDESDRGVSIITDRKVWLVGLQTERKVGGLQTEA